MIGGANQADIAVLVISARINEFEAGFEKKGQTREHVILSKAGGVKKLIVLINKMDDESVNWSEERFLEIKKKLSEFLKFLYDDLIFIPISGYLGTNIKEPVNNWYKGPSFLQYLESIEIERDYEHLLMTVVEKTKNLGSVFYGVKIESGILSKDTNIRILPQNHVSSISNIYDDEDVEMEQTFAGDTVKIKLNDNFDKIEIGDILTTRESTTTETSLEISNQFTCSLTILETKNIITPGYKSVLHVRMNSVESQILELRKIHNGKMVKIPFCRKGDKVLAKIKCDREVVLKKSQNKKMMDRFALRDEDMTVAIGTVRIIQ